MSTSGAGHEPGAASAIAEAEEAAAEHARPAPRFDWFVPIDGDGEHVGTLAAERPPTFEYLRQVVETAEAEGFHALLIPTRFANGLFDEAAPLVETWTTASALAAVTSRIRFLVAVRPGYVAPGLLAQMASTLANLSGGRLDLNVVPGGIQGDVERLGERASHDQRYRRAEELIEVCRLLWERPEPVDYHGETVQLQGALVSPAPPEPRPRFYLGGASEAALTLAGRQADQLLAWIQPREAIAHLLTRARLEFAVAGRTAEFGLRTHLVLRDTEQQAWAAAEELMAHAEESVKAQRRAQVVGTPMVGARAQAHGFERHRVTERLWNGIAEVRVNLGTAIVGTPRQAAEELLSYWRLGIDEFILSGFPHVEECRRTASELLPLLREGIEREPAAAC
jgi:alkanesulfonate monooxygenase